MEGAKKATGYGNFTWTASTSGLTAHRSACWSVTSPLGCTCAIPATHLHA